MFKQMVCLILVFIAVPVIAQDYEKWEALLEQAYDGKAPDMLSMYERIDKENMAERSLWGMVAVQAAYFDLEGDKTALSEKISEVFRANQKASITKASDAELYFAGSFSFYMLGYTRFFKVPKVSFYGSYMMFRSFLTAVVSRRKGYVKEALVILAEGTSHPTGRQTHMWNAFILKHTKDDVLSTMPKYVQYRGYLAKTRVYMKKNKMEQARKYLDMAMALYPNGAVEGFMMDSKI